MGNKLLIVEGDKKLREFLVRFFNDVYFDANGIDNYEYAMNYLYHYHYDVAIIDFIIGEDCAEYLCEWLLRRGEKTPFIITNGFCSIEYEERIRKLSPLFYFIKPYDMKDLRAVIEKAVGFETMEKDDLRLHI